MTYVYRGSNPPETNPAPAGRPSTLNNAQVQMIRLAYRQGWSTAALGRMYGVHPTTIARTLQRSGETLRPRGCNGGT